MLKGIAEKRTVLRFDSVRLITEEFGGVEALDIDANLFGGDLALVNPERPRYGMMLADACSGLLPPVRGAVFFQAKDWASLPADTANALRGRIGHVFVDGSWINRLTLLENILLPQLHHTRRSTDDLRDEALRLAEEFGLPGIPCSLPNDAARADLQRAACVRAFLGRPELILLEEPTLGVYPDLLPPLINAIRNSCHQGSAVIWLTKDEQIWRDQLLPATYRYRLSSRQLMEVVR